MAKSKADHKPLRTCIACRNKEEQAYFFRIGVNPNGILSQLNSSFGRTFYVCKNENCLNALLINKRIEKALKKDIFSDSEKKNLIEDLFCKHY